MPIEVKAMVIEPGKMTKHSLGMIDNMNLKITHNGKTVTLDKDEVVQKIFTEKNWFGNPRRYYVFCRLNGGTLELMGLEEFNPYTAISSVEAHIMLHEGVTMRGARNLVTKAKGVSASHKKLMIFLIILIVIIGVVFMKTQGLI